MTEMEEKIQERIKQMDANKKSVMLFGKDVARIPCFKQSFFTGILSGVGTGIVVFMFTSKPRLATHSMVGAFGAVTMSYYSVCRYQFAKERMTLDKMKGLMKEAMRSEGVEHDDKVEEITKIVDA